MSQAEPVLIYTMGKCGTRALKAAVREAGLPVYKAHNLHAPLLEERIARARERGHEPVSDIGALDFVRNVMPGARVIRTVVVVRESVGRNVSGFFQTLWRHGLKPPYAGVTGADLVPLFFERFNHERPDQWFTQELRRTLRVDPFALDFDADAGHHRFRSGRFDVLLLQLELGNERMGDLVSAFLERPVRVGNVHESARKEYGDLNREFKRLVRFPPEYLARIMQSRVMQTFYTAAQRDHLCAYYRGEAAALAPLPRGGAAAGVAPR